MSDMGKSLAAFVLPLALGRLVEFFLGTSLGARLAEKMDNPTLATEEGRKVVRKYSTAAATVALGAAFTFGRRPEAVVKRQRAETIGSFAELLLSGGALAKVVSDYLRDQRDVARRHATF